jgi:hypothetical protein
MGETNPLQQRNQVAAGLIMSAGQAEGCLPLELKRHGTGEWTLRSLTCSQTDGRCTSLRSISRSGDERTTGSSWCSRRFFDIGPAEGYCSPRRSTPSSYPAPLRTPPTDKERLCCSSIFRDLIPARRDGYRPPSSSVRRACLRSLDEMRDAYRFAASTSSRRRSIGGWAWEPPIYG